MRVFDITFANRGGPGAFRSRYTPNSVAWRKVFERCNFTGYTGAAIEWNSTDNPYTGATDCSFVAAWNARNAIGFCARGPLDNGSIERCDFQCNTWDIKIGGRGPGSFRMVGNSHQNNATSYTDNAGNFIGSAGFFGGIPGAKIVVTGSTMAGSTAVTVADAANIASGFSITGAGIPFASSIRQVSGTTLTLSAPATVTASGVELTIVGARVNFTGDLANNSDTITNVSSTAGIAEGSYVFVVDDNFPQDAIPTGTTVESVSGNTITLSATITFPGGVTPTGVSLKAAGGAADGAATQNHAKGDGTLGRKSGAYWFVPNSDADGFTGTQVLGHRIGNENFILDTFNFLCANESEPWSPPTRYFGDTLTWNENDPEGQVNNWYLMPGYIGFGGLPYQKDLIYSFVRNVKVKIDPQTIGGAAPRRLGITFDSTVATTGSSEWREPALWEAPFTEDLIASRYVEMSNQTPAVIFDPMAYVSDGSAPEVWSTGGDEGDVQDVAVNTPIANASLSAVTRTPVPDALTQNQYVRMLNPSDKDAAVVLSQGLRRATKAGAGQRGVRATNSIAGLVYFEILVVFRASTTGIQAGVATAGTSLGAMAGASSTAWVMDTNGQKWTNNASASYGLAVASGDVLMVACNSSTGQLWFGRNGTWFASGDPSAGTNPAFTGVSGTLLPIISLENGCIVEVNVTAAQCSYAAPAGFGYYDATAAVGDAAELKWTDTGAGTAEFICAPPRIAAGEMMWVEFDVRRAAANPMDAVSYSIFINNANSVSGRTFKPTEYWRRYRIPVALPSGVAASSPIRLRFSVPPGLHIENVADSIQIGRVSVYRARRPYNAGHIRTRGPFAWNSGHLKGGTVEMWRDAGGKWRSKDGVPSSDTDGAMIGVVGGMATLDGNNPTSIPTGLTAITSASVTLAGSTPPGLGTSLLTYSISGGTLQVHAWRPTSATNPTLVASSGTEAFSWQVTGT